MKYLSNKLENLTARIESIYFIGAEFCKPSIDDNLLDDFNRLSPKDICEVLGWSLEKAEKQILFYQNSPDENILQMASRYGKEGFLVKCHIPKCSDFSGTKDNLKSWSVHDWHCEVFWLYADTFDELVHKLEEENSIRLMEMYDNDKAVPA